MDRCKDCGRETCPMLHPLPAVDSKETRAAVRAAKRDCAASRNRRIAGLERDLAQARASERAAGERAERAEARLSLAFMFQLPNNRTLTVRAPVGSSLWQGAMADLDAALAAARAKEGER